MTDPKAQHLPDDGMIACHECDNLHRLRALAPGERAHCRYCGALLYREVAGSLDRTLALALGALGLFLLANVFPFVALELEGRIEENLVISGVLALWRAGMPDLSALVFLTSVAFPFLTIAGLLWLTLPLKFGYRAPGTTTVYRLVHALGPWSLLGVFMLGTIIAFVKLMDLATVIPGVSLAAFAGLIVMATAASASFDASLIWPRRGPPAAHHGPGTRASDLGLVACHTCALLVTRPATSGHAHCPRCATPVHGARKPDSITRTWALVVSAALLVIPANVYPVMTVVRFGQGEPSTIIGGVVHLIEGGMWGLALIVLFASVVVPVLKLTLLVYLLISVKRRSRWRPRDRTRLYRVTEVVGAWSMVDIFLVGILSALVNLQALASIRPEIGASFFAAVVVITMFAAQSFDPRIIWDSAQGRQ